MEAAVEALFFNADVEEFINSGPSSPELDVVSGPSSLGVDTTLLSSPGVDTILLSSPGVDTTLLSSPGVDTTLLSSPGVDTTLLSSPGVDTTFLSPTSRSSSPDGSTQVPAFLLKLWSMVNNPETDPLICWSQNGMAFIIKDTSQMSNVLLPYYFKHSNFSSFVRQLNMYGFAKLIAPLGANDNVSEFRNVYFVKNQQSLLLNIKRKTLVGKRQSESLSLNQVDGLNALAFAQISEVKTRQEDLSAEFISIKDENRMLWEEILTLRQKHSRQEKIMADIVKFLVPLVNSENQLKNFECITQNVL